MDRGRQASGSAFIGGGAPFATDNELRGDRMVVTAVGEVDRETSLRFAEAIEGAARSSAIVELDLTGVRFMDSQGLRVIVEARRALGPSRSLVIIEASDQVRELLEMTGLAESLAPHRLV